jgi:hypothetical protein
LGAERADAVPVAETKEARSATEVEGALAKVKELHPDAALLASDLALVNKRKQIADFMIEQRIPAGSARRRNK